MKITDKVKNLLLSNGVWEKGGEYIWCLINFSNPKTLSNLHNIIIP